MLFLNQHFFLTNVQVKSQQKRSKVDYTVITAKLANGIEKYHHYLLCIRALKYLDTSGLQIAVENP